MTIYYIDPSAGVNGDGLTPATPKNTFAGITQVAGNVYKFKRGTTFNGNLSNSIPGTSVARTQFDAYYNANGTDNLSMPRPIINQTATIGTYNSSAKDFIEYRNIELRSTLTVASDVNAIFLGHSGVVQNCKIVSNCGCIGSFGKNNVLISGNELDGVSHATGFSNNIISGGDPTQCDNVQILNNRLIHRGGASATNCIGISTSSATLTITNLIVEGNVISPPDGVDLNPNTLAFGMRLSNCPGVIVRKNNVRGHISGVFLSGGSGAPLASGTIEENIFNGNYNFGIHLGSYTRGILIQRNECSFNGTSIESAIAPVLHAYGRGIEISAGNLQNSSGGHTIRFNKTHFNKNWGGPSDNGSEGCGIGIDDGTDTCAIYGNDIRFNEGNGIQLYGGTVSDSGGHTITGNILESNCTYAVLNRRTGGTFTCGFNAHITCSNTLGTPTIISGNYMTGSTSVGISQTSNAIQITKANNIFVGVPYPVTTQGATNYDCNTNVFYGQSVQRYSTTASAGNGTIIFTPDSFVGTNDLSFDPMLDSRYRPLPASPLIGAGKAFPSLTLPDFSGRPFRKVNPSIGPCEDYRLSFPRLY